MEIIITASPAVKPNEDNYYCSVHKFLELYFTNNKKSPQKEGEEWHNASLTHDLSLKGLLVYEMQPFLTSSSSSQPDLSPLDHRPKVKMSLLFCRSDVKGWEKVE